jgi:hypothetical protein
VGSLPQPDSIAVNATHTEIRTIIASGLVGRITQASRLFKLID